MTRLRSNRQENFRLRMARLFVIALFLLLAVAPSNAQEKAPLEKIRMTYPATNLGLLEMFVAKEKGFYAANGLEVELIRTSSVAGVASLLSGDADYTQFLGSAMRAAAKGAPLRAISLSVGAPFFSLAARPQFKTVKDLKGATVGVTALGGSNYVSTRMLLQHHGLDPDREVKLIAIGDHSSLYEALRIGRLDAITINPPYSVLLQREGYPLLASAVKIVSFPFGGLATTIKKISQNRPQVKKVLKAEIETLRYLHRQPQGTIDFISKKFNIDAAVAADSYRLVIDAFTTDGRLSVQGVEGLLDLEKKDGLIAKSVTVEQVADFSLTAETLKEMGRNQ